VRRGAALLALVLTLAVRADGLDARGWHEGQVAKGAAEVLGAMDEEIDLPPRFAADLSQERPTLLVYFSPACGHCRRVAAEVQALSVRLAGKAELIWVASGGSSKDEIDEFVTTFGITSPVKVDGERNIAAAMQARSTPSVLLVQADKRGVRARGRWYPYAPGQDTLVEMRIAGDPWSVMRAGGYQGNHVCGACHVQETEAWLLSHHSIAWRTLELREEHHNDKCTACHVTGAGQPGGWDGAEDSPLVDVGCEACHGPSGPHDGAPLAPRETCEGCHDAEHSIRFSYDKGLPLLDHFRTAAMTSEEVLQAHRDLHEGRAPRSLLAFDEGTYVGSEACASCHTSQHGWWKDDRHGRAMETLKKAGSDADARCVSCHATPLEAGFVGTDPGRFRVSEGVGCESCHGPGGAHVAAAGGKENIEGLGEDCPVCVIEAVCTSCHTRAWHPTWHLETHLPKVAHGIAPVPTP
jgi:hypothetical protein